VFFYFVTQRRYLYPLLYKRTLGSKKQ